MTGTSGTSLVASGSQVSFQVARGITGLLSRHCRGIGPHLTLRGKPPGVFRVVAGGLVSSRVVSGTSGKLSCCLWEIRPPFKLWGHLRITLQSLLGNRASSRIEVEHSVVLSICNSDLMVLIEFKQGSQPCLVLRHETAFLSRCKRGIMPPVEFRQGLVLFLEAEHRSQNSLCVVRGYLGFHSSWCRGSRPYLELSGNSVSF